MKLKNPAGLREAVEEIKTAKTPKGKLEAQRKAVFYLSAELENEAKEIVSAIEAKPEITKDRYGDYMKALSGFRGIYQVALAVAMRKVGGNDAGIEWALKLLNNVE